MTAAELAEALGAKKSGRQWVCKCVAHEDKRPSMLIFDGMKSVQVRCLAGCDPLDIIAELERRGLWHGEAAQERTGQQNPTVSRERQQAQRAERLRDLARNIFDTAVPIAGTIAEEYFDSRTLLADARMIEDIRFHPRCPRGDGRQSAVVVAMRSFESNAVLAIQRIFLTRQAKKDGAMMLASPAGSAMKLQRRQDATLHVCEGLESGLATIAMGHGPVWALGSAALVQSFPVLDDIKTLTIWADHDANGAGLKAAELCGQRWVERGKDVDIKIAKEVGVDSADAWSARNGRP